MKQLTSKQIAELKVYLGNYGLDVRPVPKRKPKTLDRYDVALAKVRTMTVKAQSAFVKSGLIRGIERAKRCRDHALATGQGFTQLLCDDAFAVSCVRCLQRTDAVDEYLRRYARPRKMLTYGGTNER